MNEERMRSARLDCTRKASSQTRLEEMKKFWMNTAGCGCLWSRRSSAHLPQLDFKTQTPLVHSCSTLSLYSIDMKAELCVCFERKKSFNACIVKSGSLFQNAGKLFSKSFSTWFIYSQSKFCITLHYSKQLNQPLFDLKAESLQILNLQAVSSTLRLIMQNVYIWSGADQYSMLKCSSCCIRLDSTHSYSTGAWTGLNVNWGKFLTANDMDDMLCYVKTQNIYLIHTGCVSIHSLVQ